MIKILIIGNGGREHAIAWKLAQDSRIGYIYIATGNAGTSELERVENIALSHIDELLTFAKSNHIDLTIVGSEALLVEGIVDRFQAQGLRIFGPNQAAARLEGSKAYAKSFMQQYGVKTAAYQSFHLVDAALAYLKTIDYPVVVKASGIAAGKGVIICQNQSEAKQAVQEIMINHRFGKAGNEVVIEEFLQGFEASILSFTDSQTIVPMLSAKDHKTIGEGNTGDNTGGMGVVCPHPTLTQSQWQAFLQDILTPTLKGIQGEGLKFSGVIFFGLMINEQGVYLLEYNMRMGDPETQAILPLMQNPLLDGIEAALNQTLEQFEFSWREEHAVCVVASSAGYPNEYQTGLPIKHIEKARFFAQVFIAGAKRKDKEYFTSGGRVLNVVATAPSLAQARQQAYTAIEKISFDGIYYRKDIGAI